MFYIFGGYDGTNRRNDFFRFNFRTNSWTEIFANDSEPPSARDRHTAVADSNKNLYIFAGYDGFNRVDDFYRFNITDARWSLVQALNSEQGPSPRHSHTAVVYNGNMFIFGGYDGHYRADMFKFNFQRRVWKEIHREGVWPKSRYRTATTVMGHNMYMFGGHDGARQLNDFYIFDFGTENW